MTARKALVAALRTAMAADTTWKANSKGIFLLKAPAGINLPYSTYYIEPGRPRKVLQGTASWMFKVQVKHWGEDVGGQPGIAKASLLADATAKLFHARDDESYGTSCAAVFEALNAIIAPNGFQFMNAEIDIEIPEYADSIGDKEVWCTGHRFEFEIQKA